MPHRRVTKFLRNSSNTLENQVATIKKTVARPAINRNPRSEERAYSAAHDLDEDADETMTPRADRDRDRDRDDKEKEHHRLSFPGLNALRKNSKDTLANPHASINCVIESALPLFIGDAENSTGAMVSGQMFLVINDEKGYPMDSFKAVLRQHTTQKRPFTAHCHECSNQYTEISNWSFLNAPLLLTKGEHRFPFSVLLDGHLPASLDGPLLSITYELKAEAVPAAGTSPRLKYERTVEVRRSLIAPEVPHHSVRVFPPTNIKASVHFPQVIHPIGQNTLSIRIDGIARVNEKVKTIEYWRLKKLTWRLEEAVRTVAPACEKHISKDTGASAEGAARKGVPRTDTRTIGERMLFDGWKSNYTSAEDSCIELELEYARGKTTKYSCDLKMENGTEVVHQLMVEMVVSQEWAPIGKPTMTTQTGVGRILRMHFSTIMTQRPGMGISWDNESPPIYQDVPPSPPSYLKEFAFDAIEAQMESLDGVRSEGPSGTASGTHSGPIFTLPLAPISGSTTPPSILPPPYRGSPELP